ncbi:SDR family oxidoreductase [Ktedonospora formicarum]|uniref:Nucleotide-diphosphate-sugar epimerase n=1 Tax=Ktedonospora formicarum TaxID=2778364 RepID=A0A8J3MPY0_9CHLR|nr:SDR family oxidoreductase [Ktedonospora formicarum]GHO42058.1 nucleotide-diphosphate-sugar epimerase [Ktedonospora formicarum]
MSPILITGATGHIGTHLIKQLTAKGYPVRALVRSSEKAAGLPEEVERIIGDLAHPATLSAAIEGVDRVFLMDPSTGLDFTRNMVQVGRHAGVRLIVNLSSVTAGLDPMPILGRLFFDREALIKDSGIAWTLLRPGQFMPNVLWWLSSIKAQGVVLDSIGPGRIASIDSADIAVVAATVLTQEGHVGQTYTLTGGELLITKQQVEILSRTLNRDIKYIEITPQEAAQAALANGMDPTQVAANRENNERLRVNPDWGAIITDDVERVTGHKPTSFESWCRRNATAFA